jgi:hypothetical protein
MYKMLMLFRQYVQNKMFRDSQRWTHETDLLSSSALARIRSIFEIFARGAIVAIRFDKNITFFKFIAKSYFMT